MDKENPIKDSQGVIINILKIRSSVNSYLSVFTYYIIIFYMYRNSFKLSFLIIFLLIFLSPLSAKPKDNEQETNVYYKYTHPRDYVFDLCDAKEKVVLKFDDSIGKLKCNVDFTYLVKEQMPRKGDRITFKYQFIPSQDTKNITAYIFDIKNGKNLGNKNPELFSKPTPKKTVCSKEFSIILNEDAEFSLVLCLQSATDDKKSKIDLTFNRILESTNIKKELSEEKKAAKKGFKIVPATIDFGIKEEEDDDDLEDTQPVIENEKQNEITEEPFVDEEKEVIDFPERKESITFDLTNLEEEPKQEEITEPEETSSELQVSESIEITTEQDKPKIKEETKQEEPEQIVSKQEVVPEQVEIQDVVPDTTIPVQRYEKEYLQDYAINDEIVLDDNEDYEIPIIDNPNEADENGVTLLMKAAKSGNDWEIKTLIDSNANINIQDKDGWTALMYAVRYQESLTCVELLLNAQANIKIKNNYDLTALILAACYNNNPEILKKLLNYYSSSEKEVTKAFNLLLSENHSSEFSQIAKVQLFIEKSVPLNTFYNGKTPLMYAAEFSNSTKIIKILIDNNAITILRSTEGKTAFDYAKENKNLKHDSIYWLLNKK